jgi:hypothetical protein
MNATMASQCIITLSLISIGLPTQAQATAASAPGSADSAPRETHEKRRPAAPGTANLRGTPPAGKPMQVPVPPNRAQEVEERVRSGQMEPPIAQDKISEQLEQLHSGSNNLPGETASDHSSP